MTTPPVPPTTVTPALSVEPSELARQLSALVAALDLDSRLKQLETQRKAEAESPSAPPLSRWSYASFAVVGLAVGLFSGMSASPVATALLPVLFAFLGGAGGLFLAQADTSKAKSFERIGLLAKPTVLFVASCVLAAMVGISIRTGAALSSFFPTFTDAQTDDAYLEKAPSLSERLRYLGFRQRVEAAGLPPKERQALLSKYSPPVVPPFAMAPWQAKLAEASSLAQASKVDGLEPEVAKELTLFVLELTALKADAAVYEASSTPGPRVLFVRSATDTLSRDLNESWFKVPQLASLRSLVLQVVLQGEELASDSGPAEPSELIDALLPKQSSRTTPAAPSRAIASEPTIERLRPGVFEG